MPVLTERQKLKDILLKQRDGRQRVQLIDSGGTELGTAGNPVQVDIADATGITLEVNLDSANDQVEIYGSDDGGTTQRVITTDASGDLQVDVVTIANTNSSDYDTGAGTDTTLSMGIAVPAVGGAVVIPGDATAGLKVDLGSDNDISVNAGENHIGQIDGPIQYVELTLSLDTNAYAANDVLFDTQELTSAVRASGGNGVIQSLVVLDQDDQAQAIDFIFLRTNVTIGTENSAVSISDANADEILGVVSVTTGDYVDLVNSQIATKSNLGIIGASSGSTSLWLAGILRSGTPTYTASGIKVKVGIV